jgi:hypothetical protein
MPWFAQRFSVQQILFVKIDLREVLVPNLNLDTTGRTRCISAAIVVQRKSKRFRRIEERDVHVHLSTSSF